MSKSPERKREELQRRAQQGSIGENPGRGTQIIHARQTTTISGPLPSAAQLEHYNNVLPGLADRIVKMAESNSAHRQGLEKAVVNGNVDAQKWGQRFAFVICLALIGVGAWLIARGETAAGLWVILGDVGSAIGLFFGGKLIQRGERSDRRRELASDPEAKSA